MKVDYDIGDIRLIAETEFEEGFLRHQVLNHGNYPLAADGG